jgi:hypothetical protein
VNFTESAIGIRTIIFNSDKSAMIVIGYSHVWVSKNGKDFTHITTPGYMDDFKFHPTNSDWILGINMGCLTNIISPSCSDDLHLTQNFGQSWTILRTYVEEADWLITPNNDFTISVFERIEKTGKQNENTGDSQLVISKDLFKSTPTVVATGLVSYKVVKSTKIFIAKMTQIKPPRYELQVSEDEGNTFQTIRFPLDLAETKYNILDVSEGSTFIGVEHTDTNSGNIYVSNSLDTDFSLSLQNNARSLNGKCDFKAVAGIEGIYIANVIENGDMKKTFITHNRGAIWTSLGEINLFLLSDGGRIFNHKEAPGLILANGYRSEFLPKQITESNVYMSRDAGWTWQFVTVGSHTFEISDRGSYIIIIPNLNPTFYLQYTLDEGLSWQGCNITDESTPVSITDIISDPDLQTGIFIAHGTRGDKDVKGVIYSIDFSTYHEAVCTGLDSPSTENSAYEYWEPSAVRGTDCMLGRTTKYIRRKQNANCTNPDEINSKTAIITHNCTCTINDLECDYCYTKDETSGLCVWDTECLYLMKQEIPPDCKDYYDISNGYRWIPGDTCDLTNSSSELHALLPNRTKCPENPNSPFFLWDSGVSGTWAIVIFLLVLLFGVPAGLWYYSGKNAKVYDLLSRFIPEKYLPENPSKNITYSAIPTNFGDDDLQEDAPEIDLEDSEAVH